MSSTVNLFIPCLVDQVYPEIGVASVQLLRHLGLEVRYQPQITCCGQPAFNAGEDQAARLVASSCVAALPNEGEIVVPSGSCGAMMRNFYPALFASDIKKVKVDSVASRIVELSQFLTRPEHLSKLNGKARGKVAFHNSCHSCRELGVRQEPGLLLSGIGGIDIITVGTMAGSESVCCGFGGLFSVKFQATAQGIAKSRLEMFLEHGVETIVSNDPGCIMHMRQEAELLKAPITIQHLAEFLAASLNLSMSLSRV